MGYDQVYTEAGIPRIWGEFQMSKECDDNFQELLTGINGIEIDTYVLFVRLAIKDMVKTKFNQGGPVEMYESAESGISPLMLIPRTAQEIEEDIRREGTAAESQGKITQA